MVKISPSILSADFSNLEREIKMIEKAGADMIHIDVMDAHFVPNLTFGPPVIKAIKKHTSLPFDVHLMIDAPEKWIKDYIDAGADILTIHPEATTHLENTISQIHNLGVKPGIALLPTTPINVLDYVIDKIDMVLIMTVNPGFGGQKFIPTQLEKISLLTKNVANKKMMISVDGGINEETARSAIAAGANTLVSGSYIFSGDYKERIIKLKTLTN